MSLYNFSNLSSATSMVDIIGFTNGQLGGQLMVLLFVATAMIIFMAFKMRYPINISFAVSSFITAVLAVIFRILGFIDNSVMIISFVLFFIGMAIMFLSKY